MKKQTIITFLMAIVMMAVCPQIMWAEAKHIKTAEELQSAFEGSDDVDLILDNDITLTAKHTNINNSTKLDLGQHTLIMGNNSIYAEKENGNVEIFNGNITAEYGVICLSSRVISVCFQDITFYGKNCFIENVYIAGGFMKVIFKGEVKAHTYSTDSKRGLIKSNKFTSVDLWIKGICEFSSDCSLIFNYIQGIELGYGYKAVDANGNTLDINNYVKNETGEDMSYMKITKDETSCQHPSSSIEKHEAKAPSCVKYGNIEYYSCKDCGIYFSDAAATDEIKKENWEIKETDKTNHPSSALKESPAVPVTCFKDGRSHYYYCDDCGTYLDEDCQTKIAFRSWVIPAYGYHNPDSIVKVEAQESDCTTNGNTEYYTCKICGTSFSDDKGENEIAEDSWTLPTNSTHVNISQSSDPIIYECEKCHSQYLDAEAQLPLRDLISIKDDGVYRLNTYPMNNNDLFGDGLASYDTETKTLTVNGEIAIKAISSLSKITIEGKNDRDKIILYNNEEVNSINCGDNTTLRNLSIETMVEEVRPIVCAGELSLDNTKITVKGCSDLNNSSKSNYLYKLFMANGSELSSQRKTNGITLTMDATSKLFVDSNFDFMQVSLAEELNIYTGSMENPLSCTLEKMWDGMYYHASSLYITSEKWDVGTSIDSNIHSMDKAEYYDISGRRIVQPTRSGVYISNGKKLVVK